MQLFAGELTNQNREYYKVNDNVTYSSSPSPVNEMDFTTEYCVLIMKLLILW